MAAAVDVVEASVAQLREALDTGRVTAVDLVQAYLDRITAYDCGGARLNSVIVLNPCARDDAAASDARRAARQTRGPLEGIPYTAKDSYLARGLTAAAGSPAFEHLTAQRDSYIIERCAAAERSCSA